MSEVRRVLKTQDNKYDAFLSIVLGEKRFYMVVTGLTRAPKVVKVSETGATVRLELLDQFDHGFLTCVLERGHFEEEFTSVKCTPGNVWIISEDTILRHRQCPEPSSN
ncbi:MAG: hypothetical protein QXT76_01915 [Sulfolobales archaeon]